MIIQERPAYGVLYLASVYALQSFFFYSNWWSLGLHAHFYKIFFAGLILAPLMGFIWIYYLGSIFFLTGRLLQGRASALHLRAALSWSMIPYSISLLMWLVLIFMSPATVFIQDAPGSSSIFINLISTILGIWSMILLIQSLCEVQQFTLSRSIVNLLFAWLISSLLLLLAFMFLRYIYYLIV